MGQPLALSFLLSLLERRGIPEGWFGLCKIQQRQRKKEKTDYIIPSWLCGSGGGSQQNSLLGLIVTLITKKSRLFAV